MAFCVSENLYSILRNFDAVFQLTNKAARFQKVCQNLLHNHKGGMFMTQAKDVTTNRNYKDTMFKMIFGDKKNLLQLYNAVSCIFQ